MGQKGLWGCMYLMQHDSTGQGKDTGEKQVGGILEYISFGGGLFW